MNPPCHSYGRILLKNKIEAQNQNLTNYYFNKQQWLRNNQANALHFFDESAAPMMFRYTPSCV